MCHHNTGYKTRCFRSCHHLHAVSKAHISPIFPGHICRLYFIRDMMSESRFKMDGFIIPLQSSEALIPMFDESEMQSPIVIELSVNVKR